MPSGRSGALLLAVLLLGGLTLPLLPAGDARRPLAGPDERPRLAVLVLFDQMRGDFPIRWQKLFGAGGFRRLAAEGAWFQDCHYPYATTTTGPGHTTIATGCSPNRHGIVANEWLDRKQGKLYCVGTTRYQQLPPPRPSAEDKKKEPTTAAPDRLLSPTFADALKEATGGKGRVVCLSLKDRSSVLPGGRRPDVCLWMDKHGRFVTSTYYGDREVSWVKAFNASGFVDRWYGKNWSRLRPDLDYVQWAGFDDSPGEGTGKYQGRTFPHPLDSGPKKSPTNYYEALLNSPFGNELLLELTRRALDEEKLGTRATTDFLCVSFSSNDPVGHTWGPDSQEVLDTTLRSDVILRDLMSLLDDKVGKGKWVLALSADHGVCPLPELSRVRGINARRVSMKQLVEKAEAHLNAVFPPPPTKEAEGKKGARARAKWIESNLGLMFYLNRKLIASRGLKQADVEKRLVRWLQEQPSIHSVYTHAGLQAGVAPGDAIGQRVRASFHPERSGDVLVVLRPYHIPQGDTTTGTTHGSPHSYDTHVPLLIIGPGIKPGIRKDRVSPEHAAVLLARGVGIQPPAHARVTVPDGLLE